MKLFIHSNLRRFHPWSLGMIKWFHLRIYNGCNCLSMVELTLININKRGPRLFQIYFGSRETSDIATRLTSRKGLAYVVSGWIYDACHVSPMALGKWGYAMAEYSDTGSRLLCPYLQHQENRALWLLDWFTDIWLYYLEHLDNNHCFSIGFP